MSLQISYQIQYLNGNKIFGKFIISTVQQKKIQQIKKRILQLENIKNQHTFKIIQLQKQSQMNNLIKQGQPLILRLKQQRQKALGSVISVRSRKMSDQAQWQEQSLLLQHNLEQNFIQQQPQIPPIICGYVTFPNSVFFCFSSSRYLVLQNLYAKFYESQQKSILYKSIEINCINQVKSYKRKHLYCIKLILTNNQNINMKFINKDVCKQWMGYFNQVINFNHYLKQKKQYSKKQSYQNYIQTFIKNSNNNNNNNNNIKKQLSYNSNNNNSNDKQKCQTNLLSTNIIILSDQQDSKIQSVHTNITCQSSFKKNNKTIIKLSQFQITHKIDSGSFSTIYLTNRNNKQIVLKQMNKSKLLYKGQIKYALTQLNCLIKAKSCPYIIPLYYAFQTHQYLYLALKYISYGNLARLIKTKTKIPQNQAIILLAQLVIAIEYLHELKILYRDLKPQNILLDQNGHLYLTDFGLSKELNQNQQANSFLGTPLYLAPERFMGQHNGIDYKSDIYGVGMIFFQMVHGYHPFFADNFNSVIYNIKNTDIQQQINIGLSQHSRKFLIQTLQKNPLKRLQKMSQHSIFYKLNMKKILLKQHNGIQIQKLNQKQKIQINYQIDYDYNQNNYPNKKIKKWNYNYHQQQYQ